MGNTTDILYILGVILFIKAMGSYLLMLILVEVMVFVSFLFYMDMGDLGWVNQSFSFSLLFLVTMIFEGVFGLCLMVSFLRTQGGSYFSYW